MDEMTSKMQETAETMMANAKESVSEMTAKAQETATEMSDMAKDNVAAVVESSKLATKATNDLTKEHMEFAKASLEDFAAAAKEMATVKNPSDLVKLQGEYLRTAMEKNMEFVTKTTEAMLKMMGEAAQPISTRMSVVADKVKTSV